MTLRDNTERPETISIGTNELLGTDPKAIKPAMDKLFSDEWKEGASLINGTVKPQCESRNI